MHKKSHIKNLEDIIEEFRVGNYDSFDEFYHQTNKQLYVFIYDIIRNRQSSEDLLQETYMRFLNHIDKYKKNTNYFNFLVTIARNLAINEYHKQKRMVYDEEYIYSVKEESPTDVPDLFYLLDYLNEKEREIVRQIDWRNKWQQRIRNSLSESGERMRIILRISVWIFPEISL